MEKQVITIRINRELLELIDRKAAEQYRSRTDYIIQAVLRELKKDHIASATEGN